MIDLPPPLLAEAVARWLLPAVMDVHGLDPSRLDGLSPIASTAEVRAAVEVARGRVWARLRGRSSMAPMMEGIAAILAALDGDDDAACSALAVERLAASMRTSAGGGVG